MFLNEKMNIKILTLLFAFSVVLVSKAQWSVSGVITDSGKQYLSMIQVALVKNGSGTIISFATTNKKGEYTISQNGIFLKDSFALQIQSFGFAKQKTLIHSPFQLVNFTLQTEATELPKVTVQNKPKPLRAQGDTLTYSVEKFSNPTDRVIGDVIKKLPGVEMDDNGKISYQGKPISRLYIDGDNLLDDKYNIATNSVPPNMVVSIQVLDKHQPIKALENVQYSDVPAMNIITKEGARKKIVAEGNAALGTPGLYDITINALLFGSKIKFINYYKLNNTGVDLTKEVISHNFTDNQQKLGNQVPPDLMSIDQLGTPGLAKKRWLFNNSGLLNFNNLVNLQKEVQLKINFYYLYDKQYQAYFNRTSYYSPTDTIQYTENQNNIIRANTFRTQLNLHVNKKGYYLNNTFVVENYSTRGTANLFASSSGYINQLLSGSNTSFSNEANYVKVLPNKKVIEFFSYISNHVNPQTLSIEPGLYSTLLNSNIPYQQLNQYISIPTFLTNQYVTVRNKIGHLVQTSQIGFNTQNQFLSSQVQTIQTDGSVNIVNENFANQLNWQRFKLFIQSTFDLKFDRWQVGIKLPLNYQKINFQDPLHSRHDSSEKLIPFNPTIEARFLTGKENSITASSILENSLGNITNVYRGNIFTNYREITSNNAPLQNIKNKGAAVNYYFKKTLDGFFINLGIIYLSSQSNVLRNTYISDNIQKIGFIPFDNSSSYQAFSASFNKYVFKWKTDIKLSFLMNRQNMVELQNTKLLRFVNSNYIFKLKVDAKLFKKIYLNYRSIFTNSINEQVDEKGSSSNSQATAKQLEQQMELSMVLNPNCYLKCNIENYYNSFPGSEKNQFLFLDLSGTIKIDKYKSDFQIFVNNIIGNTNYSSINISSNIISESSYTIRPRMILVKFNYRF